MKAEVNSASLADAVAWTSRVIPARPATPILSGVKLEAIDGTLQLSAFDYEVSARHHIEAGIDEPGTAVVLGKLLADIAKSLPAEKAYLSTEGSKLTVTSGKSSFSLQLMPETEYPDLPIVPANLGEVDADVFGHAITQASVAVAREENRPVLTGVKMQFTGDRVVMTATDRFRLSRASFTWTPQDPELDTVALVRGSLLRDVARSLDTSQNVVLDFDQEKQSLMGFENAGRVSTAQLIDGEFPAVDRLFADEYPIHAVLNRGDLIDAIRRVSLVAERNAPIRMVFAGDEVVLSAGAADESQATESLAVDMDGEEITVAFNPSYLVDGLSAISEPYVRMKMTTAVKAVEFNGQKEADGEESLDYRYLLVPMRFTD
ncbi:DNA polymerase III subunit beta [Bifidobacterium callimiconis]|uniref:DNA polymerase III subunit beta n=1 Tax=Bifidobacterium callimiconis TaxID=2306973 RepID=UPI001BDD25D1|nr:DNA polymerase III subunit beta [Bifidobacterium callimiconis]MBT1177063.1 DNA polymerase III subunit beta [Bifidobacterium callimiconis]